MFNFHMDGKADVTVAAIDVPVVEGTTIGYDHEEDRRRFKYVSPGGIVVIPKGERITPPPKKKTPRVTGEEVRSLS